MISKSLKKKLLGFEHTRNGTLAILSVQETKSWHTSNLELKEFMCYGDKNGCGSLLVSDNFSTFKRSWEIEERCAATLFGTTMVMSVYAPDLKKSVRRVRVGPGISSLQETLK